MPSRSFTLRLTLALALVAMGAGAVFTVLRSERGLLGQALNNCNLTQNDGSPIDPGMTYFDSFTIVRVLGTCRIYVVLPGNNEAPVDFEGGRVVTRDNITVDYRVLPPEPSPPHDPSLATPPPPPNPPRKRLHITPADTTTANRPAYPGREATVRLKAGNGAAKDYQFRYSPVVPANWPPSPVMAGQEGVRMDGFPTITILEYESAPEVWTRFPATGTNPQGIGIRSETYGPPADRRARLWLTVLRSAPPGERRVRFNERFITRFRVAAPPCSIQPDPNLQGTEADSSAVLPVNELRTGDSRTVTLTSDCADSIRVAGVEGVLNAGGQPLSDRWISVSRPAANRVVITGLAPTLPGNDVAFLSTVFLGDRRYRFRVVAPPAPPPPANPCTVTVGGAAHPLNMAIDIVGGPPGETPVVMSGECGNVVLGNPSEWNRSVDVPDQPAGGDGVAYNNVRVRRSGMNLFVRSEAGATRDRDPSLMINVRTVDNDPANVHNYRFNLLRSPAAGGGSPPPPANPNPDPPANPNPPANNPPVNNDGGGVARELNPPRILANDPEVQGGCVVTGFMARLPRTRTMELRLQGACDNIRMRRTTDGENDFTAALGDAANDQQTRRPLRIIRRADVGRVDLEALVNPAAPAEVEYILFFGDTRYRLRVVAATEDYCQVVGMRSWLSRGRSMSVRINGNCDIWFRPSEDADWYYRDQSDGKIYLDGEFGPEEVAEGPGDGFTISRVDELTFRITAAADANTATPPNPRQIEFSFGEDSRTNMTYQPRRFRIIHADYPPDLEGFCCMERPNACRDGATLLSNLAIPGIDQEQACDNAVGGIWVPIGPDDEPAARQDFCDFNVCQVRGACCVPDRDECVETTRAACRALPGQQQGDNFYGNNWASCFGSLAAENCGIDQRTYCSAGELRAGQNANGQYGRVTLSAQRPQLANANLQQRVYDTFQTERVAANRPAGYDANDYCGFFYCVYQRGTNGAFTAGCVNTPVQVQAGLPEGLCVDNVARLGQGYVEGVRADGRRYLHPPYCRVVRLQDVAQLQRQNANLQQLIARLWGTPVTFDEALNRRVNNQPVQSSDGGFKTLGDCNQYCRAPGVVNAQGGGGRIQWPQFPQFPFPRGFPGINPHVPTFPFIPGPGSPPIIGPTRPPPGFRTPPGPRTGDNLRSRIPNPNSSNNNLTSRATSVTPVSSTMSRATSRATSQGTSRATSRATSFATTSRATSAATSRTTSRATSAATTSRRATSEATSRATSEATSRATSEATSAATSGTTSRATSEATSAATSGTTSRATSSATTSIRSSSTTSRTSSSTTSRTSSSTTSRTSSSTTSRTSSSTTSRTSSSTTSRTSSSTTSRTSASTTSRTSSSTTSRTSSSTTSRTSSSTTSQTSSSTTSRTSSTTTSRPSSTSSSTTSRTSSSTTSRTSSSTTSRTSSFTSFRTSSFSSRPFCIEFPELCSSSSSTTSRTSSSTTSRTSSSTTSRTSSTSFSTISRTSATSTTSSRTSSRSSRPLCEDFPELCSSSSRTSTSSVSSVACPAGSICSVIHDSSTQQCRSVGIDCPGGSQLVCSGTCGAAGCGGSCCRCMAGSSSSTTSRTSSISLFTSSRTSVTSSRTSSISTSLRTSSSTTMSTSFSSTPFCVQFPDLCEGGVPRHELPGAICGDDRLCISIRVGPGPDLCREIGIRCPLNTRLVCDQGCGDNSCIGRCCNCLPEASVSDLLCGNGVLDPGESCDDANNVDIDACSNDCRLGVGQSCVNAVSCVTDICRDNVCAPCVADDECRSLVCQDGRCLPLCGNGMRDPGEECDDGNRSNADACTNECYRSNDQPCAVGEECQSGLCRGGICSPCNRHEECGQKLCIRRQCQRSPVVGNGIVEFGEECDDGNTDDGDGCTSRGTIPPSDCGNGVLDAGEECDQGGDNSAVTPDRCRMDCRNPRCGDGIADSTEQCDDGNGVAGDGCDRLCRIELRALAVDLPWNPFLGNVGSVALTRPPAGQTGPAALVFMAAGGAAAWAAMRRRRR